MRKKTAVYLSIHLATFLFAGCRQETESGTVPGTAPKQAIEVISQLSAADALHRAVEQQDWQSAKQRVEAALIGSPNDPAVIEDVAHVKAFTGKKREAALLLIDAAGFANYTPPSRVQFAIGALIEVGELYPAIELLEKAVQANPDQHQLRRTLLGFLGEAERYDKIPPHLQKLIQARRIDIPLLIAVTENSVRRFSTATIDTMLERNPSDHRVRLGTVQQFFSRRDVDAAARVLREIVQHHPKFAPAQALIGQTLMEDQRLEELSKWAQQVPQGSKSYASYWIALGDFAAANDRPREAARAFWEATQRDPNNSTSWSRLTQSLRGLKAKDSAFRDVVSEAQLLAMEARTDALLELQKRFYIFSSGKKTSQSEASNVAESLFQLGRNWEAEAWSAIATQLKKDPAPNLPQLRSKIITRLREDQTWVARKWNPALQVDLSRLPQPSLQINSKPGVGKVAADTEANSRLLPSTPTSDHIQYSDRADEWGLAGVGAKSNPHNEPVTVIRTTGVGAGVIDYELDGNTDILTVGGGGTINQQDSQLNQLLRNLGTEFQSTTLPSGVADPTFGQGVAVGDYNEDGFPDMFFANLGTNRLLRNNGDGTFTDRTADLNEKTSQDALDQGVVQWTTCGAFADLDADQITDLVITNYCQIDKSFDESPSQSTQGKDKSNFHPLRFPAQSDGLFLATGDGKFADHSTSWTMNLSEGRGLGVIAGTFDGENLGIYVANDMSANHFVSLPTNEDSTEPSSTVEPLDSAAARGLAVDARTLTQASMGIANGDFDGDGDFDFYVSGFAGEYNIYYEQVSPGLWVDRTSRVGLVRPTLMMVGFGTEAIDMDNDGIDELIVTNGSIDGTTNDSTVRVADPERVSYEQPLQIFRRNASGKFSLLDDDAWGKYFVDQHVGRALVSADFNRDGHVDALVTQKHEGVSLLINETRDANHRIAFQLVATDASRDAVGAIVRFDCGKRKRTLWKVSGDGYMCSSERILRAGLGTDNEVRNVTVRWQDGSVDDFGTLSGDKCYLLVQHAAKAFTLQED